jgi:hypothetical protein
MDSELTVFELVDSISARIEGFQMPAHLIPLSDGAVRLTEDIKVDTEEQQEH